MSNKDKPQPPLPKPKQTYDETMITLPGPIYENRLKAIPAGIRLTSFEFRLADGAVAVGVELPQQRCGIEGLLALQRDQGRHRRDLS